MASPALDRLTSHRMASCSSPLLPAVAGPRAAARPLSRAAPPAILHSPSASTHHVPRRPSAVAAAASSASPAPASEPAGSAGGSNGNGAGDAKQTYSPLASLVIDEDLVVTKFIAETLLPTRNGKFRLRGYKHSVDGGSTFTEPTAIIAGTVEGKENVAVRVHDACFTSEVLGSLKCDCAEQLELALQTIQKEPPGIVIYLQQEGRGIGLANKIAAYSLQEQGLDTVDANRALGLPDDCREYTSVRNMLKDLDVKSIRLVTNNPRKMNTLTKLGINVTGRIPCLVAAGEFNQGYLEAKRDRMAHMLPEAVPEAELNGDFCFWDHDGEPTMPVVAAYAKGGMDLPAGLQQVEGGRVVPVAAPTPAAAAKQ